jgi:hypothetical protein
MNYDFEKIQGPRQSKRENFEELISQLLAAEMNAEAIDGSGGDAGIDCFIKLDQNRLIIFQSKYFLTRLTPGHRSQIKHSFETACRNHRLSRWILCIPINPTPKEKAWFETLSVDDISLEWWGDTKIRTLIARHPEIARAFFPDDSLISEFNTFRQEIMSAMGALKASCWSHNVTGGSHSVAHDYLERAARIGELLILDAPLLQTREDVYIGLDACELYTYMSSDPRSVISTPVVDFCIQNSPQSLYLLPGTVVELNAILRYVERYRNFDEDILKSQDNPLQNFINAFEQQPDSQNTRDAYQRAVEYLRSLDIPSYFNLGKLRSALETGMIMSGPDDAPDVMVDQDEVASLWQHFMQGRPQGWVGHERLRHARLIDVRNLLFLKNYAEITGGLVRMISSDRVMARASHAYFGKASFTRDSSEYAYLVYSSQRLRAEDFKVSFESEAGALIDAASALEWTLRSTDHGGKLIASDDKYLRSLLDTFHRFAPYYRTMLRPVDRMIEDGLLSLPTIYAKNMWELYAILKRESDLVASFKSWWDHMCQELKAIEEILQERYLTDGVIRESRLLENK